MKVFPFKKLPEIFFPSRILSLLSQIQFALRALSIRKKHNEATQSQTANWQQTLGEVDFFSIVSDSSSMSDVNRTVIARVDLYHETLLEHNARRLLCLRLDFFSLANGLWRKVRWVYQIFFTHTSLMRHCLSFCVYVYWGKKRTLYTVNENLRNFLLVKSSIGKF